MSDASSDLISGVVERAADHQLALDDSSIRINEMGLDFRVALVRTLDGDDWVLRIPRRPEVMDRAAVEGELLRLVSPQLGVAVPQWAVHSAELIAYPLLPGEPGLVLDPQGEPQWQADVSTPAYAHSLGDLLAQLHAIDPSAAKATGVCVLSPAEVREAWSADIKRVQKHFEVAADLSARWDAWLSNADYWPEFSVLTHGEIYPGHTLISQGSITGVLDWTTASVGDPAKDFMFHHATASPEAFDLTVTRYAQRGGRVWPTLAAHCAQMFSASPVAYGIYALDTDDAEHQAAAAAQLNPQPSA